MKKTNNLIFFLLLFLSAGCGAGVLLPKREKGPITVQGTAIGKVSELPIKGVKIGVGLFDGDDDSFTPIKYLVYSKEDGSFLLEADGARHYLLYVSKDGFCFHNESSNFMWSLSSNESYDLDFEIAKILNYNLLYKSFNIESDSLYYTIRYKYRMKYEGEDCSFHADYYYSKSFNDSRLFNNSPKQLDSIFSHVGLQGFDHYLYYELYEGGNLTQQDSITFRLEKDNMTIEITN